MNKFASIGAALLLGAAISYAGPESIRSSSKEMKETVAPAPPSCDFTWTGFYIGGRLGGAWTADDDARIRIFQGTIDFPVIPDHQGVDPSGFVGGGELGFNWQLGHFVLGAEADFSGGDLSDSTIALHDIPSAGFTGVPMIVEQDINWYGTVRGRIGFAPVCRLLIYGTGGFAYADVDNRADIDFRPVGGVSHFPASNEDTQTGWTAGGGLEFALAHHWTIKAEYLYIDVGDESTTVTQVPNINNPPIMARYRWDTQFHTVTAGLNFKF